MNKGTATIGGIKYTVEVKNGVRYIDGKTVDEFLKGLPITTLAECAIVGYNVVKSRGTKSPQKMFNELHQSKNN